MPGVLVWNGYLWAESDATPPDDVTYGPTTDYGRNLVAISSVWLGTSASPPPGTTMADDLVFFDVVDTPAQYKFGKIYGACGIFIGGNVSTKQAFYATFATPVSAGETASFQWSDQIDTTPGPWPPDSGSLQVWFNTHPTLPTDVIPAASLIWPDTIEDPPDSFNYVPAPGYIPYEPSLHMIGGPWSLYPNPT